MKLAFCIFNFFPYGGVQRDMLRVASACLIHGHEIDIYTMSWEGEKPARMKVRIVPVKAMTNHGRAMAFSKTMQKITDQENYDLVVGFNKMSGLDVCFVGDLCFKTKVQHSKNLLHHFLPRYRAYLKLEKAVFGKLSSTQVMLLTPKQQAEYHMAYGTPFNRMALLPPGLEYREQQKIAIERGANIILLFVATKFHNKGLDRAINALASLGRDDILLHVVGGDDVKRFQKLARDLKVEKQVKFLGAQDNLFEVMADASILIHPARVEAAGMVLIESIITGLPVLTTANCGYAFHVENAKSGIVLDEPYSQEKCNQALSDMMNKNDRVKWQKNAFEYSSIADLYHLGEKAVAIIEAVIQK